MSTPATPTCPKCGQPILADAPAGLCPRCLAVGAFSDTAPAKNPATATDPDSTLHIVIPEDSGLPPDAPRKLGKYELIEEIARGGMGIVYKAWQPGLERFVAVKTIRSGLLATSADVERFQREAKAAAKLRHPNIIAIHEIGEQDGQHYFAMDYVSGENLATLARQQPFLPEQAAQITATVANAIHYAHQQSVLHRDLKPANVILSPDGPRVLDFGLARLQQDDSQLTQTGTPMGSPCYMSPEQAAGSVHTVDARSDVYSLGAMLYELLTGRPPFQAASIMETLRLVQETEPVTLRRINPTLPADLETICLKCLEKQPTKRYQSALELSEELGRFGRNEPIHARPVTTPEKVWRWCRRKPVVASLSAATILLLLAVAIGSPIAAFRIDRERKRAVAGELSARQSLYGTKMRLAQDAWEQNNVGRLRQLLEDTRESSDRGFEWYYWQRQTHLALKTLQGHLGVVVAVAFSPDGQRIVTGSGDKTAIVWEAASGRELLKLKGHSSWVGAVAFSPDSQRIVTGSLDQTARVWDAASGRQLLKLEGHTAQLSSVAISRDGKRIVTGSADHTAIVWDAFNGTKLLKIDGHSDRIGPVAFSPDGQRIVIGIDQTVKVYEAASGRILLTLEGHGAGIWSAAFSPDGQWIVTGSDDQTARVWEAASGRELLRLTGHRAEIRSVAFSPDGKRIVTGSYDQTAKMWDAVGGRELLTLKGHTDWIWSVAFSPDGQRIATASEDQTAKVWDAAIGRELPNLTGPSARIESVALSPDGHRIVTGSWDQTAKVWETASGRELLMLEGHSATIGFVAFSPDGQRIVTGSDDQTAKVWEAASGRILLTLEGHGAGVWSVAFSPDGQRIVTGSGDRTARVWETATGRELLRLKGHSTGIRSVAFSADGQRIVTGSEDHTAKVWDAVNGKELRTLKGHSDWIHSVAFSSDGQRIVTGSVDRTAKVWEAASGRPLLTLKGHSTGIGSVAFSRDGRRIVTGSDDGTAKVWEAASGRELLTLKGHSNSIRAVAFSADGQQIVTGSFDQTARVWEAARAEQVAAWQEEERAAERHLAALQRETTAEQESQRMVRANDEGTIKRWLILAPIALASGQGGAEGLDAEQIEGEAGLRPKAGERSSVRRGERRWQEVALEDYVIDFNAIVGHETLWSVAYAVCYIRSEAEQRELRMLVGSDDEAKVYLNGKQIHKHSSQRSFVADMDAVPEITLNKGLNVLVFKVVNEIADWWGSIRFTDAQGNPVAGIKVTLTP